MKTSAENKQTVEAALAVGRKAVTRYPSGYRADYFDTAATALRDIVAQADRAAELEAENERLRANQRTGRIIHGDALAGDGGGADA